MSDIPPECLSIAQELEALRGEYFDAQEILAEAQSPSEKAAAGRRVNELRALLRAKERELDACLGCADPATATYEDSAIATLSLSDPRVPPSFGPMVISAHSDSARRGLSFVFAGCHHETISERAGWAMLMRPSACSPSPCLDCSLISSCRRLLGSRPRPTRSPSTRSVRSLPSAGVTSAQPVMSTWHAICLSDGFLWAHPPEHCGASTA
jgi:hypothetical protein